MNEVFQAALELQAFCEEQGWRHCFIGGLALQRWGEARETVDVDLTLLTGFGGEENFIRTFLTRYDGRLENTSDFALRHRVLLLRAGSGVGLDIALAGLPFEESAVSRSSPFAFSVTNVIRTCSAEDLIVMKAFAARPKDWIDVQGIIIRQAARLDWDYIHRQLQPLAELKGDLEIVEELKKCRLEFEH